MRPLFILLLLFFFVSPAFAGTVDQLRTIEAQLSQSQQQKQALDTDEQQAAAILAELRQKLIAATEALQEKQNDLQVLEDRLTTLATQIDRKSKELAQERQRLSATLSVLMEVASRPPESLFLQNQTTADHIHRSLLLKAIIPVLKDQAERAARDLETLYDMKAQLAAERTLATAAEENLEHQQKDLSQLIAARQGALQRTEAQKAQIAEHLAGLAVEARDLRQLMQKIAPKRSLPHIKEGAASVALKWPVSGSLLRHYGEKDADGVVSEGITLTAPSGAPIVAPYGGKVVFVGLFRGYGHIVILQHEGGYHSLLSGFGRIDTEMGQEVDAGEPLGVLPVKVGVRQNLYFEWRRGEKPQDPENGLAARP